MERYDVARNRWEFVACMEERRYRPAVAAIAGKMYILGGEEGWDRYHGSIESYDPATGKNLLKNKNLLGRMQRQGYWSI